ncbi:unnamed protein product, partial [Symbiodinium natans]
MASVRGHSPEGAGKAKLCIKRCNRCKYIKHAASWQKKLVYSTSSGGTATWLVESDSNKPWGLGCAVCRDACDNPAASGSAFVQMKKGAAQYEVPMTRFGGMLQLEDLRRHGESDGHIRSLEKLGQPAASPGGSEEDKAVPTPAQVRLALEVLRMPSSAQGRSYEARCELAGRADCRNFPAGRSCATEHARIIRTVAEVLWDEARQWPDRRLAAKCKSAGWAEDVSKDSLCVKMRLVDHKYQVHHRMLALSKCHGVKAGMSIVMLLAQNTCNTVPSLGKVEHMGRVLQKFSPDNHESFAKLFQDRSPGSPAVLWAMRAPLQVYTVDGEKAEGLAGRFAAATGSDGSGSPPAACTSLAAKAKGVLPSLKLSTRCRLHSAQRSLENSLKSDGNIKILLDEFVMRLSSQNSKDPGGFCRAIGNSHKLLAQFSEKVQSQLDCVLGPQMSAHYVLTPSNIRLLALTTEWLSLVSPFVHEYDRGAAKSESAPTSSTARISNCSRLCENLKQDAVDSLVRMLRSNELLLGFTQDLNRTFAFKSLDGSTAQRPLVLNSNYTSGYLQIAEQQMKALSSSSDIAVYQDGRLLFHSEGVPDEEYAALLAPELGSIKNVSDLFLESVETWHQAGVGSALSPFDVVWWTANRSDSTLPEVLDPLAKLLQLDTHVLREEYLVARPTAVFLARSERAYWPTTMQRFDRLKSLKVRFMLAIFDATSEIETSFSTLRLFSGSIKASMSEENRNCYLKVFCDCPDLDKVVFFSKGNYQPSSLGFKILDKYRKLYGGQGRNTRRDRLPRKSFCSRLKSKGLASFQRQRDAQRRSLQQPDAEEGLEDLQQVVDSAARRRASPKQEKLRAILQAKAAELKQDFVHGPGHGIAAKLSEHERNVLKDKEKLQRIEMRQLHEQLEELAPGPCTFVILGSCVHLKTRAKKQLARVSSFAGSVFYSASEFLNGVSQEVAMDCKRLVWVCVEPETFQKVLGPQNGVEIPAADAQGECWKEVSIILATRVLGGYVASGQWPSLLANRQDASVPSPIIRLGAAYAQPHNIYMSKLPEKLKGCLNHLDAILR